MNTDDRRSTLGRLLYAAISVLLILAAFWSIRLACADAAAAHADSASLQTACRLAPASATYWLRSAEIRSIDALDDPAVDQDLARALLANPRSTEARLALAVRDESLGRMGAAEQGYLAAARLDHMYKPAWALANFYLRQDQPDQFWIYARKCLEVVEPRRLEPASYNPAPLFDLAWRVSRDPREIRRRLIPPRHFILVDYLEYLAEHDLPDAGAEIALDLTSYRDPGDSYVLLNFCDRLINLARPAPAAALWNAMIDHHILHSERLDPAGGQSLINGDLQRPFQRAGFDWRMPPVDGVLQNHFPDTGEVRFQFTGDQGETVLPLYQNIPVVPGAAYRLTFRYQTPGMDHVDGLSWQLLDFAGRIIPATGKLAPHPHWSAGEAAFTVPQPIAIVRLGLVCQRATGSTRIRGTAGFRELRLQMTGAGR